MTENHEHHSVRVPVSRLPETVQAQLAEATRHPQCLITGKHAEHQMYRATRAGFRCGGTPKPPRA
jgi:hypothetical protein